MTYRTRGKGERGKNIKSKFVLTRRGMVTAGREGRKNLKGEGFQTNLKGGGESHYLYWWGSRLDGERQEKQWGN